MIEVGEKMGEIINVKFEYDTDDELDEILETIEEIERFIPNKKADKKRRKNHQIQFRMSDENYLIFLKRIERCGLSKTEFLTRACTSQTIKCVSGEKINDKLEALSYEVNRYGNNLNQIAKRFNERDFTNADKSLLALNGSFEKLINEFVKVRKEIRKL